MPRACRLCSIASAALSVALGLLAAVHAGAPSDAPVASYAFSPCTERAGGPAASVFERTYGVVITPTETTDPARGVESWSVSLAAVGLEVVDITTAGTTAARVDADPPGLRDIISFEYTSIGDPARGRGDCAGLSSAVSVVVLSPASNLTLPSGPSTVARVTVRGRFPDTPGGEELARLQFVDGCVGERLVTNDNYVTWSSESRRPMLEACEFVLAALEENKFLRGDANDDGQVRLADAITILHCLFGGGKCPVCLAAGDANDDGEMTLTDAINVLSFLYLGGPAPLAPGPFECGVDPTRDANAPCLQTSC